MSEISPPVSNACVFCAMAEGKLTPDAVAFRDSDLLIFPSLHQNPENHGHTLVVPVRHIPHVYEVDRELGGPLLAAVGATATAVKRIWEADGISVRQNNEPAGGQDVFHLHFHIIPRHAGESWNEQSIGFSKGLVEVPHGERLIQANRLRQELQGINW